MCQSIFDKLNDSSIKFILINNTLYFGIEEAAEKLNSIPIEIQKKIESLTDKNYNYISKEEAKQYLQTLSILKSNEI